MAADLRARVLARAASVVERGAERFDAMLNEVLAGVPDARRVLVHLDRYLEASFSASTVIDDVLRRPALAPLFVRLVGVSGYAADLLVRDPQLFRWLSDGGGLEERPTAADLHASARAAFDAFDREERRIAALKRWHRREMLGVIARDLTGRATLEETTTVLSHLADAVVRVLTAHACARVEERHAARLDTPLVIIALGKLGGGELNYSSDIDLMAVYGDFETRTAIVTTHDLAVRTIELLIHLLTTHDRDGFFYRTDFRLRPDGAHGALALSRAASVAYYESRGAQWERQMLLKARVVAGCGTSDDEALAFGDNLLADLDAFVHPRTILAAPSDLLAGIDARLRERQHRTQDVKHCAGGIRSIEFAVQALQLIHGGDRRLRAAGSLAAIDALAVAGHLTDDEAGRLRDAYRVLRRTEHMLQLDAFEQTHTLPDDDDGRRRIAWALGFEDAAALDDVIARVRADVCAVTAAVFALREDEGGGWTERRLADLGFADPATAVDLVDVLGRGRLRKPHTASLRMRAAHMLRDLVPALAATMLPDNALRSLEQLVNGAPSAEHIIAYLEHPRTRPFLVALAARAPVQLRRIITAPIVLDAAFGGWARDADMQLGAATLRLVRDTDAVARWALGGIDIAMLGAMMSDTADHVVRGLFAETVGAAPMCLIALGKYGSRELMPGSDLDVVFVAEPDASFSLADAQDAAARFLAAFSVAGAPEPVYTVDARLRPEGRRSPLVPSLDAYRRYLAERASPWERQSLVRMRPIAGSARLMEDVQLLFSEALATMHTRAGAADEMLAMRRAMEPVNRFRSPEHFDLKISDGGLVDAEFAVQYRILCASPSLPTPMANTFAALDAAVALDTVEDDTATGMHERECFAVLRDGYRMLRTLQLHLRLVIDTPSNLVPQDDAQRTLLARAAGVRETDQLFAELRRVRATTRAALLTLMRSWGAKEI